MKMGPDRAYRYDTGCSRSNIKTLLGNKGFFHAFISPKPVVNEISGLRNRVWSLLSEVQKLAAFSSVTCMV